LAAFAEWADRSSSAPAHIKPSLEAEGIARATVRRNYLAQLIQTNPEAALAAAVPWNVRNTFPDSITSLLESRVGGEGNIELLAVTPAPGLPLPTDPVYRVADVGGQSYRASVYGARATRNTQVAVSIQGISLDGNLAVLDSPVRVLDAGESLSSELSLVEQCPISGIKTTPASPRGPPVNEGPEPTVVQLGNDYVRLCSAAHIKNFASQAENAETAAGPYKGAVSLAWGGDSTAGSSGVSGRPDSSWTHGSKKVLIIRVDFSDLPGTPVNLIGGAAIDAALASSVFDGPSGIETYFQENSFGKTTLNFISGSDVTPILRLPQTASYYAVGNASGAYNTTLHTDARVLATAAGYPESSYDRIGVVYSSLTSLPGSKITYGGLGNIEGKNFWINGYFNFGLIAHEIAHTYGLYHANWWKPSDGSTLGTAADLALSPGDGTYSNTSIEYGDSYDILGTSSSADLRYHLNAWFKNLLQWLPDTAVTNVTASGIYRIARFDHTSADYTTNKLALKIARDSTRTYWVSLRKQFSGVSPTTNLNNAAYILWGYHSNRASDLIRCAGSSANTESAGLAVGQTLTDSLGGVTITVLSAGGSSPNEYLDVQVTLSPRISYSMSSYGADSNASSVTLTLDRIGSSSGAVSVNYATANATALSATHYTASNGTVFWANGDSSSKTIVVPLIPGSIATGSRRFSVTLSGISGGVIINQSSVWVNIFTPGSIDPTFNHDFVNSTVETTTTLPDGRIVLGGNFTAIGGSTANRISRILSAGRLDPSLDAASASGASAAVYATALQTDGKILLGGDFTSVQGNTRTYLARLNADGSLDSGFNPTLTAAPAPTLRAINTIALQPDGKILIGGGFTNVNGTARSGLARLNSDGSLDASFVPPAYTIYGAIHSIALQSDNKPIIGGEFSFSPSPWKAGVARLNTNGTLDASFDPGYGAHLSGNRNSLRKVSNVAVQSDGNILVGGPFTGFNETTRAYLVRLTSVGAIDASFNPTMTTADGYEVIGGIVPQADGKILLVGNFSALNGTTTGNFGRLNANGTTDTSFNANPGSTVRTTNVELQPDGTVLIAGSFGTIQGTANRTMTRLFSGLSQTPSVMAFRNSSYNVMVGATANLPVLRGGGTLGTSTVSYSTIPGTALAGTDFTGISSSLTWSAGNSTPVSIGISIPSNATAGRVFYLNLATPIGGSLLGPPSRATLTLTSGNSFDQWRLQQFPVITQSDDTISGASANPMADGVNNLLKYALGLNPLASAPLAQLPAVAVSAGNRLQISFTRDSRNVDLSYEVQASNDLASWTLIASSTAGAVTQNLSAQSVNESGAGFVKSVTVEDTQNVSGTKRFIRLRIVKP